MPFNKKFFTYIPPKIDVVSDAAHLEALYGNTPVYFEDWLEKNPDTQRNYTDAKVITPQEVGDFKASDEHKEAWKQIETVIRAIGAWATKNGI